MVERLGPWLEAILILRTSSCVLWAGCRIVVGRLQIDALWHLDSSGLDTWASVMETSSRRLRLQRQRRAGHGQCCMSKEIDTCHNQDCKVGRKWLALGWSPATIAADAIEYVFLSFGCLLRGKLCLSFFLGPTNVHC